VRPESRKPTVRDVAAEAQVSVATVSRVLTGAPKVVSPHTRQRVFDAAARLGYQVNIAAQSLATGRHGNVAVIVPELTNPHFTMIVRSLLHVSNDDDMQVFVADSQNSLSFNDSPATEMLLRSDGLILCSPRSDYAGLRTIFDSGKPVVTINRLFPEAHRASSVRSDVIDATRQIVDALLDFGHRSFGFVVAQEHSQQNAIRWEVLDQQVGNAGGIAVLASPIEPFSDLTADVRKLVDNGCTAIVAVNDLAATAIIYALSQIGLSVPADISVAGFDDTPLARWVTPRLTTARMHEEELGRNAWDAMKQLLSAPPQTVDITFHAEAVFRDSIGPSVVGVAHDNS